MSCFSSGTSPPSQGQALTVKKNPLPPHDGTALRSGRRWRRSGMVTPSSGTVFNSSSAAVSSLASGATRNWPITPCSSLNAARRLPLGAAAQPLAPRLRRGQAVDCHMLGRLLATHPIARTLSKQRYPAPAAAPDRRRQEPDRDDPMASRPPASVAAPTAHDTQGPAGRTHRGNRNRRRLANG